MEHAIEVYDTGMPQLQDDSLIRIAAEAEARINAVNKIKQIALKVTNARDWTDQNGNPYLQVSGAEKVAGVFNVSWRINEPIFDEETDGHFTYTYTGHFSIPGREIEVSGSRSSKDPFFKKYDWVNGVKTEKPISAIDKRDVKMAAMTNLLGNGITRLLGIRNLTWEDLEAFAGVKKDQCGKVEYKKKGNEDKPPISQPQSKSSGNGGDKISEAQKKRFYAMAKGSGKSDDAIKAYLTANGLAGTSDIPKADYDRYCQWAEKKEESNHPADCAGNPKGCKSSQYGDDDKYYCADGQPCPHEAQ